MQILDLTYPIHEGMTTFHAPWHPLVSIKQLARHAFEGRETREISFGTHTGTQIDAPLHFIPGGASIDQVELSKLIGPVDIIDATDLGENEPLTVNHLASRKLKKKLIFKFGWGKHWGSKKFYHGYPFFSTEAAQHLVDNGVEMVAIDTPSPDDSRTNLAGDILGTADDSPIHKILLAHQIALVEYVANLNEVTDYADWIIVALPLKIGSADGSPARICLLKNVYEA